MTLQCFTRNALIALAFAILTFVASMSWKSTAVTKPYPLNVWGIAAGGPYPSDVWDVAADGVNATAFSSYTQGSVLLRVPLDSIWRGKR